MTDQTVQAALSIGVPSLTVLPKPDFTGQMVSLKQHYTILDSNDVIIKLLDEKPSTYLLLIEAVKPLQNVFGPGRIIRMRAQISDDDSLIKIAVQLPRTFEDPEYALSNFDADWWLNNCNRSGGALVFDYEIQDAL